LAAAEEQRVLMGVITGAHGVKGAVRVKSFTAEPAAITAYGALETERGGRKIALELTGTVRGMLIARVAGVSDRDAAERLKGTRLYLPRAALPEPGEDEFYHADLVGLVARLKDGSTLGRVRAVLDYGAGDSLEVETPEGGVVIVPFTADAVPEVDIPGGTLVIEPPAGLFDNRPAEVEEDEETGR
jgi:16S rRNA processing protein RimM